MFYMSRRISEQIRKAEVLLDTFSLLLRYVVGGHDLLDCQKLLDKFLAFVCLVLLHSDLSNETEGKGKENVSCIYHEDEKHSLNISDRVHVAIADRSHNVKHRIVASQIPITNGLAAQVICICPCFNVVPCFKDVDQMPAAGHPVAEEVKHESGFQRPHQEIVTLDVHFELGKNL